MKNLRYFNSNLQRLALSGLNPYLRKGADLTDVLDAVEDALNPSDLEPALKKVLPTAGFVLDRERPGYVRVKRVDRCGNVEYILVDRENGKEGFNVCSV